MAKVVNTFTKGKLNKDLDARLVPNGEYRDARNVQVSKSEGPDVGELENVLGNELMFNFRSDIQLTSFNNRCIGYLADESTSNVYLFITSYTDPNPSQITYNKMAENAIVRYNTQQPVVVGTNPKKLVEGNFLNFSTTNPIYGVNLLEGLLYWTDNRNQPRVINLDKAEAQGITYYTTEDQISVAKYNPWQAIQLFQESALGGAGTYETTMKDVTSLVLPNGGTCLAGSNGGAGWDGAANADVTDAQGVYPPIGTEIYYEDANGDIIDTGATVGLGSTPPNTIISNPAPNPAAPLPEGTKLVFNPNPYYDKNFAGDPSYLEDLFVRFSYRYRYEDNEYSLMAPFTQIAFIPKQDGYFMYIKQDTPRLSKDDQSDAYRSTVVQFVENKVDEIKLIFNLPFAGDNLRDALKIKDMQILIKESDGLAIRIIDTITIDEIESQAGATSVFTYDYLSKKPFKVLTTAESTRVSDQIPVRAFAQEISGNRVIYGNFQNKHTPPKFIDYNVGVSQKDNFNLLTGTAQVDGNQTIGVGDVLVIKNWTPFDGSSDILVGSEVFDNAGNLLFTVTGLPTPNTEITVSTAGTFLNNDDLIFRPIGNDTTTTSVIEYPNSTLKQNRNYQVGVVLSDRYGRQSSVILSQNDTVSAIAGQNFIGDTVYNAYLNPSQPPGIWRGDSLKVLFNSTIGPSSFNRSTLEPGLYNGNANSSFYNPLGWYSYKIVVKQTEQEYYNVYLPGIMAAYPEDLILEENSTSHAVLINDNINKVPRDLTEVGPDQKQYRSSVQLFGRVENTNNVLTLVTGPSVAGLPAFTDVGEANTQYYPEIKADTVSTISVLQDLFDFDPLDPPRPNYFPQFYLFESNPSIARISTQKKIGQVADTNYAVASGLVVTAGDYTSGTPIQLKNINGTFVADMVVVSPGLPDDIFVSGLTANPDEIELSQDVTLEVDQLIQLAPGYPADNEGEPYLPGLQFLSVYETSPFVSNLDIYWESTTSGLISDLNNLIINSTEGAAGVDGFNPSNWDEGLTQPALPGSPRFISNTNFFPVDSFGVAIDPADITDIQLLSVTDQDTNLRTNYFELYGAVGNPFGLPSNATIAAGTFNISITTDYYNNVYYTPAPGNDRLFNFYLSATTNVSGTATLSFQFLAQGPKNVDPSFTITPGSKVVNTDRQDTSNLFTFAGINGADNPDLRVGNLSAQIVNIAKTFAGVTTQITQDFGDYFNLNITDANPPTLDTALTIADSAIDPGDYDVTIEYQDALDIDGDTVTVRLDRTPDVSAFKFDTYLCYDEYSPPIEYSVLLIEVSGSPIAAQDGVYLYDNTLNGDSLNGISNGTGSIITINADQALTVPTADPNPCAYNLWYSSTMTLEQIRNEFSSENCINNGSCDSSSPGWDGLSDVDISGYTVEIIGTP
tara:strand:- start:1925 stop:6136 length:4212 start_codon:yes stop_codon:yes gene_type:complete